MNNIAHFNYKTRREIDKCAIALGAPIVAYYKKIKKGMYFNDGYAIKRIICIQYTYRRIVGNCDIHAYVGYSGNIPCVVVNGPSNEHVYIVCFADRYVKVGCNCNKCLDYGETTEDLSIPYDNSSTAYSKCEVRTAIIQRLVGIDNSKDYFANICRALK